MQHTGTRRGQLEFQGRTQQAQRLVPGKIDQRRTRPRRAAPFVDDRRTDRRHVRGAGSIAAALERVEHVVANLDIGAAHLPREQRRGSRCADPRAGARQLQRDRLGRTILPGSRHCRQEVIAAARQRCDSRLCRRRLCQRLHHVGPQPLVVERAGSLHCRPANVRVVVGKERNQQLIVGADADLAQGTGSGEAFAGCTGLEPLQDVRPGSQHPADPARKQQAGGCGLAHDRRCIRQRIDCRWKRTIQVEHQGGAQQGAAHVGHGLDGAPALQRIDRGGVAGACQPGDRVPAHGWQRMVEQAQQRGCRRASLCRIEPVQRVDHHVGAFALRRLQQDGTACFVGRHVLAILKAPAHDCGHQHLGILAARQHSDDHPGCQDGHQADPQLHDGDAKDLHQHEQEHTGDNHHQRLQDALGYSLHAQTQVDRQRLVQDVQGRPIDAVEPVVDKFGDERRPEEEGDHTPDQAGHDEQNHADRQPDRQYQQPDAQAVAAQNRSGKHQAAEHHQDAAQHRVDAEHGRNFDFRGEACPQPFGENRVEKEERHRPAGQNPVDQQHVAAAPHVAGRFLLSRRIGGARVDVKAFGE